MTPEEHKRARYQGRIFIEAALSGLLRAGSPVELLESYAGGIAEGVGLFLTAHGSDKAAYELLQRAADAIANEMGVPSATESGRG